MARGAREAVIRMGVDRGYLRSSMGGAERDLKSMGGKIGASLKKTMSGAFDGLQNVAGFLGIAGLATAANDVLKFEQRLHDLGVNASATATQLAKAKAAIMATSKATGVDAGKLLGGLEVMTDLTGNIDGSIKSIEALGRVARGSGADMADIAAAAAALNINLGVEGPDMTKALGAFMAQAEIGAVSLKDLAKELAGLTPQFAQFGDVGVEGTVKLGAALQILRNGFGSTAEAATGMQSLMTKIVARSGDIEGLGVKVFDVGPDGVQKLRSFADIAFELIAATKGDPEVLLSTIKDKEAVMALLSLTGKREKYNKLVEQGAKGEDIAAQKFERAMKGPMAKIDVARAKLSATFNEQLVKHLPAITDAITKLAEAFGFMAEHSGAIIAVFAAMKAASFAKSLAGNMGNVAGIAGAAAGRGAGRGGVGKAGMIATAAGYVRTGGGPAKPGRVANALSTAGDRLNNAGAIATLASIAGLDTTSSLVAGGLGLVSAPLGALYGGAKYGAGVTDRQQDIGITQEANDAIAEQNARRFNEQRARTQGFDLFGTTLAAGSGDTMAEGNAAAATVRAAKDAGIIGQDGEIDREGYYKRRFGDVMGPSIASMGGNPEVEELLQGVSAALELVAEKERKPLEIMISASPLLEALVRGDDPAARNGGM
jgi:hypothetical protein